MQMKRRKNGNYANCLYSRHTKQYSAPDNTLHPTVHSVNSVNNTKKNDIYIIKKKMHTTFHRQNMHNFDLKVEK